MVGRTISHYEIVEKLGEGGMGVVYKARDTHLDRFVAIKVLPPEKVADPERKRRFVQEAKSASALNHPNIITIHDIASDNGLDYIAMEYVPGKPLNQLIARRGLPLAEALKYAVQIADALAAAHAAGIIHRDLKPANVMLSGAPERSGFVKVLDFGLAKLTDKADSGDREFTQSVQQDDTPASGEGSIVGTVSYMSPEQAEGKKVDARSDIFSFGSLLYEMVTGRRAFQGDSRLSTLSAVLREEPKPASQIVEGLPHELERIIARCLRKSPERRYQTMADLKVALQELKEESDSGTLSAPPAGQQRPRRRLVWAAALLAAFALGVGTLWLMRSPTKPPAAALNAIPLTTYTGFQFRPSFSPDGNQVAFVWNGEKQNSFDTYVKMIGTNGPPLRLTTDAAPGGHPAWSPDGRFVAFLATGLVRHRSIADLMRYAIINEGLDTLAYFGGFQPSPGATVFSGDEGTRYSDEQLYALALYISSLKPPPNPNPVDDRSRHGQQIFQQQGCAGCHIRPLYTSNKLTPALGFKIPEDLLQTEDILSFW